jgi:hypothetical protein
MASTGQGDHCKLLGWNTVGASDLVVQVACWTPDGSPEEQDFVLIVIQ